MLLRLERSKRTRIRKQHSQKEKHFKNNQIDDKVKQIQRRIQNRGTRKSCLVDSTNNPNVQIRYLEFRQERHFEHSCLIWGISE